MKKLLFLNLCFLSLIPLKSIAQSDVDTKATSGAKLICDCTKTSLSKNFWKIYKKKNLQFQMIVAEHIPSGEGTEGIKKRGTTYSDFFI